MAIFKVVLADGRTIAASKTTNADLFWALKGGANIFGILTNIRMEAVRNCPVWGGLTMLAPQTVPFAAEALVDFASRVHEDVDSNLMYTAEYRQKSK